MIVRTSIELGNALRARRRELGLAQEEISGVIGVNRRVIGELERGKGTVQLQIAMEAARAAWPGHRADAAQQMNELIVYLCGRRAGRLIRKDNGNLQFRYDPDYAGPVISQALPVQQDAHPHAICRAVFGGLLLEGEAREALARNLGISIGNDYALLQELGGDCAGAVTLLDTDIPLPAEPRLKPVDDGQLDMLLRESASTAARRQSRAGYPSLSRRRPAEAAGHHRGRRGGSTPKRSRRDNAHHQAGALALPWSCRQRVLLHGARTRCGAACCDRK